MSAVPHNRSIHAYVHKGRIGVLVELGSDTQMVTSEPEFLALAQDIAMHVAAQSPPDVEALLNQRFVKDQTLSVSALLAEASTRLREKITITRFVRWDQEPEPPQARPTPPKSPAMIMSLRRK